MDQDLHTPKEEDILIKNFFEKFRSFVENINPQKNIEELTEQQLHEYGQRFFDAQTFDEKNKELFEAIFRHASPKEFKIIISGFTGIGKSSLLNFLFNTDFSTSEYGRGTIQPKEKVSKIAHLQFRVLDLPGLGDSQSGYQRIDMQANNEKIRNAMENELNTIIQTFDFNDNRENDYNISQLRNIFSQIDFTRPKEEYLGIIDKIIIVFLQTNKFESRTITKKQKIDEMVNKLIELNENPSDAQLEVINKFIQDYRNELEKRFERLKQGVKAHIHTILTEREVNPEVLHEIQNKIKFAYAGDIDDDTRKAIPIPQYNVLWKGKVPQADWHNTFKDNWKSDLFNIIFKTCGNKHAASLFNAVPNLQQQVELDEEAENSVNQGIAAIFKDMAYTVSSAGVSTWLKCLITSSSFLGWMAAVFVFYNTGKKPADRLLERLLESQLFKTINTNFYKIGSGVVNIGWKLGSILLKVVKNYLLDK